MPTFEKRPPRIEAVLYDGTNAAEAADLVGGSVGPEGELLADIWGEGTLAPITPPVYITGTSPNIMTAAPADFEADWKPVST